MGQTGNTIVTYHEQNGKHVQTDENFDRDSQYEASPKQKLLHVLHQKTANVSSRYITHKHDY